MRAHVRTRVFTDADQARFAGLSGDLNPIHVDPLAARRTQAGAPVVHGVHAVLWALESLIEDGRIAAPIASLSVQFLKFVYAGAETALFVVRETPLSLRADVVAGGLTAVRIDVGFGGAVAQAPSLSAHDVALSASPAAFGFAELRSFEGVLSPLTANGPAAMFPAVAARLGAARTATVMQLSALVGMVCPGLHSIFGGLSIRVAADAPGSERLSFSVTDADERVRMLTVAVGGGGIAGELTAFVRPAPVAERDLAAVARDVRPGEFASSAAVLIVGGSRGLGAVTARAVAAGGGRVVVTYLVGEAEARAVAAEIGWERCRIVRYDARGDASAQLAALDWDVTQLYYFATPQIFRQKAGWWDPSRFAEFCDVYVDGFARVCAAVRARSGDLVAFYPSSVAVEEHPRDMTEYSMAKAAGEMLCADMNRFERGIRVVVKRLPRIDTDQTSALVSVPSADPLGVMLPVVRELHALAARAERSQ